MSKETEKTTVLVDKAVIRKAKIAAATTGQTIRSIIEKAIVEYLDRLEKATIVFDTDFRAKANPKDLEDLGWDFTTGYEQDDQLIAPDRLKWDDTDYILFWADERDRILWTIVHDGIPGDAQTCDTAYAKKDIQTLANLGKLF